MATIDGELEKASRLFSVSEDEARQFLDDLQLELPGNRPADPFSDEYREWTWKVYRGISGRTDYAADNEASPFDLPAAIIRPYPFATGSAAVVGADLLARGHLLRCIGDLVVGLAPPARIVEFGPGWGNLTNDLVAIGFEVTAVEVDAQFCSLIQERCSTPENLTVTQGDMLTFASAEPFDAAIFFESFHHCSDHLEMLRRLHRLVRPGGSVFFASEPVQKLDYPWGPRIDGLSAWSSRTYGWLELGFDTDYFDAALARTGWRPRHLHGAPTSTSDVIVAQPDPRWPSGA
jgi:SAM-dependent methyltransferase